MKDYGEYDQKTLKKLQGTLLDMLKDFNYICEKYDIKYFALDGTGIGTVRHDGFIPWDDDIDIRMFREDYDKFVKYSKKEFKNKYYMLDYRTDKTYPYNFPKWCLSNTRFIDDNSFDLNLDIGIFIDIYIIENMPDDEKLRNKLIKKAWRYQKIGLLSVIKNPVIQGRGIKQSLIRFACKICYYILKLFRINHIKMYKKADKIFEKYGSSSVYSAYPYETTPFMSVYKNDELFPLIKHKFNNTYTYLPKEYDKYLRMYFGDYMQLPPEDKRHNHYPKELTFNNKEK